MIDEANIESHGMGYGPASLAKDSTWLTAHMDRTHRMYERSKNHPAIVIWSLEMKFLATVLTSNVLMIG